MGIAVFAAVGAMSHEHERAFSASLIYLGLGAVAAAVIQVLDIAWLDPIDDGKVVEHVAEVALIFALFSSGLKLDRPLRWREWGSVTRLLALAMPLTMAGVALFASQVMGLTLGAALLLGAILSPTDPVLAGDLGVGPPGDEEEHEPNFALTAEAGGNDGLAAPLVLIGIFVAEQGGTGWIGEWLVADLLYAVLAGVAIGAAVGWSAAWSVSGLRDRELLAPALRRLPRGRHRARDLRRGRGGGRLRLPRRLRRRPGLPPLRARPRAQRPRARGRRAGREVHGARGDPAARLAALQRRAERARAGRAGCSRCVLLVVIRPLSVLLSLLGSNVEGSRAARSSPGSACAGSAPSTTPRRSSTAGVLSGGEERVVVWTAIACVIVSIVVHGVTGGPAALLFRPARRERRAQAAIRSRAGDASRSLIRSSTACSTTGWWIGSSPGAAVSAISSSTPRMISPPL